jgi:group II intron reverse transcriptase/maturase
MKQKEFTKELEIASGPIRGLVAGKIKVIENMMNRTAISIQINKPIPIFNNLMPIVSNVEVLLAAYNNIKSNAGSITPGTQGNTVDGTTLEKIEKLSLELKNNTYTFPDVRRVWLPKPIKGIDWKNKQNLIEKGRPLGMPDFNAKIVQEAIRIVLNAIYEPIFEKTDVSFGFRPNKGPHDAVKFIRNKSQGMEYVIEGDIKAAFPSLDHNTLIKILSRRIQDNEFLKLILKACQAGIMDKLQNTRTDSLLGVPQGGIVSPTLWNIYMHEFDKYILTEIQELIDTVNKKQNRSKTRDGSSKYKNLVSKQASLKLKYEKIFTKTGIRKLKNLPEELKTEAIQIKKTLKTIKIKRIKTPSKNPSRTPIKIYYVRYADDWILFTNSKPALSQLIRNKIGSFLKYNLGLTLSYKKTKITHLKKEKAKFLGFTIKLNKNKKISYTKLGQLKRVTGQKVSIGIDKERLKNRLEWRGYLINGKIREQPAWTVFPDSEIINKYNAVIRGYINYYAPLITTRSTLNYYVYIFEYSCYKTLCHKHRTTIRKLLKQYGNPLKTKRQNKNEDFTPVTLLTCKTYWKKLEETVKNIQQNLYSTKSTQYEIADSDFLNNAKGFYRTKFKLTSRCLICGSKEHIEIHHKKRVRGFDKEKEKGFDRILSLLNRKQVPLCRHHHKIIHDGKYDDISLSDLSFLYDQRVAKVENSLKLY